MDTRILEATGFKKEKKYFNALQDNTYTCKCGHRVVITRKTLKTYCSWCGRAVYKNPRDEFKDRLGVKLYGRKD